MRGFAALTAGVIATSGFAWVAGCSAAGSNDEVHGPAFDFDGGATDDGSASDAVATSDTTPLSLADSSARDSTLPESDTGAGSDTGATSSGDSSVSDTGAVGDAGGCTSTTAVLGGSSGSIFGARSTGTGALTSQTLTGSVTTIPALVPFGSGFQGLFTETGNALEAISLGGSAWSSPTAVGASADAIDGPGLAPVGTTLQAVYLNPQHLYFHAAFSGTWDIGTDPVRLPNDAGAQAFGPVRAAAAGTATELVIVYEGNNLLPYAQTWTSGVGWDNGVALAAAPVVLPATTPLALAPLGGGGASDLLAVYVDGEGAGSTNNLHLFAVRRNAGTTTWSSPTEVSVNVYTAGGAPGAPSLTAMTGGRVLLAWQGQSGGAYTSVYTAGSSAWSTPAQLTSAAVTGPPSVAPGICGDDAEAAYVSGGSVYAAHFVGGAWTPGVPISGVSGASFATIATAP